MQSKQPFSRKLLTGVWRHTHTPPFMCRLHTAEAPVLTYCLFHLSSWDTLSPPLPSMTTVCHAFSAYVNHTNRPARYNTDDTFHFILFITVYPPPPLLLSSSCSLQVAVPQPHSHWGRLFSSPQASASEALLWEIPPETKACTLNANVQPHLSWTSERLQPLEQRHTVYNTDTYACNLDTQQSTHLLLLRPYILPHSSVIFGSNWDICHWGARVLPGKLGLPQSRHKNY